ncbi:hypothetical protein KUV28_11565 [Ferrimonas balearica]|nr:hypothetical protein [Ferrimonas balearica]
MSPPPVRPVFLERQSYRQRRLIDAARLLPILGVLLLAVPLLWPEGNEFELGEGSAGQGLPVSRAMIYIFSVWAGLAIASALLVWRLSVEEVERLDSGGTGGARGAAPDLPAEFVLRNRGAVSAAAGADFGPGAPGADDMGVDGVSNAGPGAEGEDGAGEGRG